MNLLKNVWSEQKNTGFFNDTILISFWCNQTFCNLQFPNFPKFLMLCNNFWIFWKMFHMISTEILRNVLDLVNFLGFYVKNLVICRKMPKYSSTEAVFRTSNTRIFTFFGIFKLKLFHCTGFFCVWNVNQVYTPDTFFFNFQNFFSDPFPKYVLLTTLAILRNYRGHICELEIFQVLKLNKIWITAYFK